jgi:hypothetical protein
LADFTVIPPETFDTDAPVLGATHLAMYQNLFAVTEGALGAPRLTRAAMGPGALSWEHLETVQPLADSNNIVLATTDFSNYGSLRLLFVGTASSSNDTIFFRIEKGGAFRTFHQISYAASGRLFACDLCISNINDADGSGLSVITGLFSGEGSTSSAFNRTTPIIDTPSGTLMKVMNYDGITTGIDLVCSGGNIEGSVENTRAIISLFGGP